MAWTTPVLPENHIRIKKCSDFVGANLSSPQLFFEVLDGHSVDNRVIVANHRQRTGQRTLVTGG